jgi:organic hydroperoxide reductase OsmC/OhrA
MDRKGKLCSPELSKENGPCIEVATPPEFPKGMPGIWSPEHLFTAAVSSCLMTTFLAIAENSKQEPEDLFFKLVVSWKETRDLALKCGCDKAVAVADEMFPYLSPNVCGKDSNE